MRFNIRFALINPKIGVGSVTLLLVFLFALCDAPGFQPEQPRISLIHFCSATSYTKPIGDIGIAPGGNHLLVSYCDFSLKGFEFAKSRLKEMWHEEELATIPFWIVAHPDGKTFALHGRCQVDRPKHVEFGELTERRFQRHNFRLDHERAERTFASPCFAFFQQGKKVLYSSIRDTAVEVWPFPIGNDDMPVRLRGHTETVEYIRVSKDSSLIATVSLDDTMCLWDVQGNTFSDPKRLNVRKIREGCLCLEISRNNHLIAAAWAAEKWGEVLVLTHNRVKQSTDTRAFAPPRPCGKFRCGAFLSNCSLLLAGDVRGNLVLWRVKDGHPIATWTLGSHVCCVSVSDDERLIAVGCWDGTIHFFQKE